MTKVKKLSLGHQFFVLLLIFAIGFGGYGYWSFKTLDELKVNGPLYSKIIQNKDLIADILPPPAYIIESYLIVLQMESASVSERDAFKKRLAILKKDFDARQDFWQNASLEKDMAVALLQESKDPAHVFFKVAFDQYVPALEAQNEKEVRAALKAMNEQYELHRTAIDKVVAGASKAAESDEKEAIERVSGAAQGQLLLLVAFLMVALLVTVKILNNVLKRLGGEPDYAATVCKRIADGHLDTQIHLKENDRQSLLFHMKAMQLQLAGTVEGIKAVVLDVNDGAAKIEEGNLALIRGGELQAASLSQTEISMNALSEHVKANAENAKVADELAHAASKIAKEGGVAVEKAVGTMKELHESSKKIVDIISVMDSIAFQTNILALNASVEAARAGLQGRGFAVVADEVRHLAQRSATAAKEIKDLIDSSVQKTNNGTQLVSDAGITMGHILQSVNKVTEVIEHISKSSGQQYKDIHHAHDALKDMDRVIEQNAIFVNQANGAAEGLQQSAVDLKNAVKNFK